MSESLENWDKVAAFALTLPGSEAGSSYRMPNVKVAANGREFVWTGHEAHTSFAAAIDLDTVEILKETEPETYWQSPHYEGYPAVLIRYDSPDPERVRSVIERAFEYTAAKKPVKPRKKK